ncbi:TerB family tellurite resistance protein [Panacagrimonas sp.]|uniref:tellurite resistance TerB family protein n=1 Tax=Panacagrimonas sp. TaxID=2480088 RepID=UPI003B523AE6
MLKQWLSRLAAPDPQPHPPREVAIAVLLLECARADFERQPVELAEIRRLLGDELGLPAGELDELIADAERSAREAVSLHGPVSRLNQDLSADDKRALMAWLWRVAHADGHVDAHEEHLLRQIADLLYVPHADFIRTRLAVGQGR